MGQSSDSWFRPQSFTFLVTDRCNSRCQMCNVWQYNQDRGKEEELTLSEIRRVFDGSRFLTGIRHISLSGGEPFLRDDLSDIITYFYQKYGCIIAIPTNGFLTERIVGCLETVYERNKTFPSISLSLDGLGETHDIIRGIPGGFKKVINTMEALKKYRINLTFSFTITPDNYSELEKAYHFAKEHGVAFSAVFAQTGAIYRNETTEFNWPESALRSVELQIYHMLNNRINKGIMSKLSFILDYTNYFMSESVNFERRHPRRNYACYSGLLSFTLTATGDVRPCVRLNDTYGNLRQDSFDQVWSSSQAKEIRGRIARRLCNCWTSCETMHTLNYESSLGLKQKLLMVLRNIRVMLKTKRAVRRANTLRDGL